MPEELRREGEAERMKQNKCLGTGEMYFTAAENDIPCAGEVYVLPDFFCWTESGDLSARICKRHSDLFLSRQERGYLRSELLDYLERKSA